MMISQVAVATPELFVMSRMSPVAAVTTYPSIGEVNRNSPPGGTMITSAAAPSQVENGFAFPPTCRLMPVVVSRLLIASPRIFTKTNDCPRESFRAPERSSDVVPAGAMVTRSGSYIRSALSDAVPVDSTFDRMKFNESVGVELSNAFV